MSGASFGVSESNCATLTAVLIAPLKAKGCNLFVFGSRARGDYKPFSDLDILVEGVVEASELSAIRELLEESSLPFRVDIVLERDLAESYRAGVKKDMIAI